MPTRNLRQARNGFRRVRAGQEAGASAAAHRKHVSQFRQPGTSLRRWMKESKEYIRFVNPGDLRVAEETCGTAGCHAKEVRAVQTSMMTHGAMLWAAALYNNGGPQHCPVRHHAGLHGPHFFRMATGRATSLFGYSKIAGIYEADVFFALLHPIGVGTVPGWRNWETCLRCAAADAPASCLLVRAGIRLRACRRLRVGIANVAIRTAQPQGVGGVHGGRIGLPVAGHATSALRVRFFLSLAEPRGVVQWRLSFAGGGVSDRCWAISRVHSSTTQRLKPMALHNLTAQRRVSHLESEADIGEQRKQSPMVEISRKP